jgi:hypothetical protein
VKLNIFIFIIIFALNSCVKRESDTNTLEKKNNTQQSIENKETASQITNEGNVIQQGIETGITEEIRERLLDYFPDGNYQILDKLLDVKYRKIIFALHSIKKRHFDYMDEDILICDTIVGF